MLDELAWGGFAAVSVTGACARAPDWGARRQTIGAFGVPDRAAPAVGWTLIGSELAIGTALLLDPTEAAGAAAALALLAIVSVAVAANLIGGRNPECHCFGRMSRGPVG